MVNLKPKFITGKMNYDFVRKPIKLNTEKKKKKRENIEQIKPEIKAQGIVNFFQIFTINY